MPIAYSLIICCFSQQNQVKYILKYLKRIKFHVLSVFYIFSILFYLIEIGL